MADGPRSSRQTWWVAVKQPDGTEAEPEVAQVWFKDADQVEEVLRLGDERGLWPDQVRLIERVLPAGRAAAAVEKLEGERDLARASAQKLHQRCRQAEAHIAYLEREAELDRQTIAILRGQGKRA